MRVKIFIFNVGGSQQFERELNDWLAKARDIDIFKVVQSETVESLTITIFYTP